MNDAGVQLWIIIAKIYSVSTLGSGLHLLYLFFTDVLWVGIILNPFYRWRMIWGAEKITQIKLIYAQTWTLKISLLDFIHCITTLYDPFPVLDTMVIMKKGIPVFCYVLLIHSTYVFKDKMLLYWHFNHKELL